MKKIWKFELETTDMQKVSMPFGAQILCIQTQNNKPCLWALVEDGNSPEEVTIEISGTGNPVKTIGRTYIGTYQLANGKFVGHVFTDLKADLKAEENAIDLKSAYNNTVGKSINPESVPSLLEALKRAKYIFEQLHAQKLWEKHNEAFKIIGLINSAIEKAKI